MDWVKALLECSTQESWIQLRNRMESDFEHWLSLTDNRSITVDADEDDLLTYAWKDNGTQKFWSSLERLNDEILWKHNLSLAGGESTVAVKPFFTEGSECHLLVGDKQLEFWQASQEILKPLFSKALGLR